uniref:Uncharacterized protein n=1 Tax=Anguilla anguilla TaxID=7936 RepID=A0A0E9TWR8_ANGAN
MDGEVTPRILILELSSIQALSLK